LLHAEIFKRAPEVMFRALVMHNATIRTAKYANCGFVLEQEGDSFTLAFYNAFDAVAFCLQVRSTTGCYLFVVNCVNTLVSCLNDLLRCM
jgi:hypothetical protein